MSPTDRHSTRHIQPARRNASPIPMGRGRRLPGTGRAFLEGGTVAPGSSPGLLSFDNLGMGAAGGASFFLGGTDRGTGYSAIDATNDLILGGLLSITLGDGFLPEDGDSFELMLAGSLSGSFSGFALPQLDGLSWSTAQTDRSYTLNARRDGVGVIPLPAGGWPLVTAFGALAVLRRRRGRG